MVLSLKTFGGFVLRDEVGAERSLSTRKTRALLAYLAVNADKPQPREKVMSLLWSDRTDRQARQSLNHALKSIRRLSEDGVPVLLDSNSEQVTLHGAALDSDTARFKAHVDDRPAEAASVYDGPFLEGLSVPDPAFEEWLTTTRSAFHADACEALWRAAESAAGNGDTDGAINKARNLVALDPLREDAHRLLMRLLYAKGDRAGALRQYQACADILKRELQVEPDTATMALFEKIRQESPKEANTDGPTIDSKPSTLPNKPSIAVLPFDVIGNDPQANALSEGLTEDLTAALAKVPELFVVACHSTGTYKGKAVKVQEVAEALGVRYVLEGSIQKYARRLRITSQLIDAVNGHHLWAERYDRPKDVFSLQDEIVRQILIELQVRLTAGDSARSASQGADNLDAWLLRVQGFAEGSKRTRDGLIRARVLLEAAHQADPNWARPLAGIAWTHRLEAERDWSASREESIRLGIEHSEQAIAMDPLEPLGYQTLGGLHVLLGDYGSGLALLEKAVALAPNDFLPLSHLAKILIWVDEIDRALELFQRARRICPIFPPPGHRRYGLILQLAGQKERAVDVLKDLVKSSPEFLYGHVQLAAVLIELGKYDAGRANIQKALELDPGFTTSQFLRIHHFQNTQRTEWLRELLFKAGLPE